MAENQGQQPKQPKKVDQKVDHINFLPLSDKKGNCSIRVQPCNKGDNPLLKKTVSFFWPANLISTIFQLNTEDKGFVTFEMPYSESRPKKVIAICDLVRIEIDLPEPEKKADEPKPESTLKGALTPPEDVEHLSKWDIFRNALRGKDKK